MASTVASFIGDPVVSGLDREAAETAVAARMVRLLPDRVTSLGHRFRSIEDQGRTIGRLWYGPMGESPNDWYPLWPLD